MNKIQQVNSRLTVTVGNVEIYSTPSYSSGYIQQAVNAYNIELLNTFNSGEIVALHAKNGNDRVTLMSRIVT